MPTPTYTLLASNVLTTTAASVTFSNIPDTYTDLVLRTSTRNSAATNTTDQRITFNGVGGTSYSTTQISGFGGGASSSRYSNQPYAQFQNLGDISTSTPNTFDNQEIYIPSYTVAQEKSISWSAASENNAAGFMGSGTPGGANVGASANYFRNTSAISSIAIINPSSSFASGSSFFLYGIKNS